MLVAVSLKAAIWWFVAFAASVVDAMSILVLAVLAYFARQRDRFQRRSDDLLHNILPTRSLIALKDGQGLIADDFPAASVLSADVVNFTPMSAGMAPAELVGLLNDVFTSFDELVAELGLEKIKTVGDEYMVAAGEGSNLLDRRAAQPDLGPS